MNADLSQDGLATYRRVRGGTLTVWLRRSVPRTVLPDGEDNAAFGDVSARKGTVAAFIANAETLDELADGTPERDAVLAQLRTLAPGLRAVGVLDVFIARSPEIAALFAEDSKSS